jgi:putative NADH-flavin reductase
MRLSAGSSAMKIALIGATGRVGSRITGKFRLGKDQLLSDAARKSSISMEDFAIAMIDELEHPAHSRQRFTVGY